MSRANAHSYYALTYKFETEKFGTESWAQKKRTDYFKSKNTFRASRNFEYLVCLDGCDTRSMYVVFRLKSKRKIEFSCKRITEIEIYDNFTGWFSLRHFIRFSYNRKYATQKWMMECKWMDFCMFCSRATNIKQGQSLPKKYKILMHKMRALTNSKTRRIVVTSKVPGEMNLNVNIHRKPYFNIYQNENGNLSSNKIERENRKKRINKRK